MASWTEVPHCNWCATHVQFYRISRLQFSVCLELIIAGRYSLNYYYYLAWRIIVTEERETFKRVPKQTWWVVQQFFSTFSAHDPSKANQKPWCWPCSLPQISEENLKFINIQARHFENRSGQLIVLAKFWRKTGKINDMVTGGSYFDKWAPVNSVCTKQICCMKNFIKI